MPWSLLWFKPVLMQTIKHRWPDWVAVEEETQANRAHSLSLPEHSCSASVYPQTSPLVNRLGLNPAVSFFLRLSLPPSLCLLACLFTSAPLLYSCDGRWKNRVWVVGVCVWGGGEKGEKKVYICVCVCVRKRGRARERSSLMVLVGLRFSFLKGTFTPNICGAVHKSLP